MTQEIRLVDRIKSILEKQGALAIKTHGSGQRQGEPDIYCCYPYGTVGITVVIEVKRPKHKPRPLQMNRLKKWASAGAIAFWTDDPNEVLSIVQAEIIARRNGRTILQNGRPIPIDKPSESEPVATSD